MNKLHRLAEDFVRSLKLGEGFQTHIAIFKYGYQARDNEILEKEKRIQELEALINTPETQDFVKAVNLESAHQRVRWGTSHDGGKTDADWFWLIGYLAGKALHNPGDDQTKKLHRIITVAAAAQNWHLSTLGNKDMRPGIDPIKVGAEHEETN